MKQLSEYNGQRGTVLPADHPPLLTTKSGAAKVKVRLDSGQEVATKPQHLQLIPPDQDGRRESSSTVPGSARPQPATAEEHCAAGPPHSEASRPVSTAERLQEEALERALQAAMRCKRGKD